MEDDDSVSADDDDDEYTSQSSNEDAEEANSPQSSPERQAKASIKAAAPEASQGHSGTKRKKLADTMKTPPKKKIRTSHDKVSPLENVSTPPLLKTTTPSPRRSRNKGSSIARHCSTDPLDLVVPGTGVESLLFVQLDDDGGDEEMGSRRILDGASGAIGRMEQIDDATGEVSLDIQGIHYTGKLLPGPSLLLVTQQLDAGTLRVDGIANDFVLATRSSTAAALPASAAAGRPRGVSNKKNDASMAATFMHFGDDDINVKNSKQGKKSVDSSKQSK